MYDQIYWMLCFGGHHARDARRRCVPEMARYTVFVDGISKAFAATGVRVGWGVGPADVIARMSVVLGARRRLGAARRAGRRPSTCSTTREAIRAYHATFLRGVAGAARPACTRACRR